MSIYRVALPGDHTRHVIAHLMPGDTAIVQTSVGERSFSLDGDFLIFPWISVYDDDAGVRLCPFESEQSLTRNTLKRLRQPVIEAARAVRRGGVAVVVWEQADYHGRTEWRPVGHEIVQAAA